MAVQTSSDRLMSDINVTPFVDVMLVLLIIFMVTAPMMMQGVDVALPETTSEPLRAEQKEHLIITINSNGNVFINDFQVTVDFLQQKLLKILEGRTERQVYLRADKQIPYGIVAQVMAQIQAAGVTQLGMVTEPADKGDKKKKS